MKLGQFLEEANGQLSAARLFALSIGVSFVIDYQHTIWSGGRFDPSWTTVGVVLGALGLKVAQKFGEDSGQQLPIQGEVKA